MILFKQNSFSIIKICLHFCLKKQNEVAYAGIIANGVSCMGMWPVYGTWSFLAKNTLLLAS